MVRCLRTGRPIVRGAEYQAGQDGREANAGGRKAAGNQVSMPILLWVEGLHNRPDTSICWARKGADACQVSLRGLDASAADRTEGQVRHPRW